LRVFFGKKDKPRERFYLLPGQGGRSYRRKQKVFICWAVAVAVSFGVVLAVIMWLNSKPKV
jgi:hypothetical protein